MKIDTKKELDVKLVVILLAIPIIWLFISAAIVDIEYYDGFDAICNTSYIVGESDFFIPNRAPFVSFLLIPAFYFSKFFGLDSLNVTFYHLQFAIIHAFYLIAVYWLLKKQYGNTISTIISFFSAVTCYVFFSYAPFLSHDIFPGLIFLIMLLITHNFVKQKKFHLWLTLIVLGAISALIKQTYGIFWVCAIFSGFYIIKKEQNTKNIVALFYLVLGAFLSLCIYWIVMGTVLKNTWPNTSFWLRPLQQLKFLAFRASGATKFFGWVYFANFPYYGLLSFLCMLIALWQFLKRSIFYQIVMLSCLISFIVLHFVSGKEVRYLAFLMPLTAFLIVPIIEMLLSKSNYSRLLVLIFLALHVIAITKEASCVFSDFYRNSELKKFTSMMYNNRNYKKIYMDNFLSFVPKNRSPFLGDPYHKCFHFAPHHIKKFILKASQSIKFINAKQAAPFCKNGLLLHSNRIILNTFTKQKSNFENHLQCIAVPTKIDYYTLKKYKNILRLTLPYNYILPCLYNRISGRSLALKKKEKFLDH